MELLGAGSPGRLAAILPMRLIGASAIRSIAAFTHTELDYQLYRFVSERSSLFCAGVIGIFQ
ncbi:hypothetical protein [Leucobacter sp. wl10]|uniref:hypothetical protein n=1 Tax=Leucobacter sp. wl10 TaxID=2304677 RepID=UPI000E5AAD7F|nr:hypothetical protein [Leucobacter sp. wl10]RGE23174.1 hypothetical protein D1J51_02745 [Leucobacter sp. wl10]